MTTKASLNLTAGVYTQAPTFKLGQYLLGLTRVTYTTPYALDFSLVLTDATGPVLSFDLTGDITFSFSNLPTTLSSETHALIVKVKAVGAPRTVHWPAGTVFAGGSAPGAVPSGETAIYFVRSFGPTSADVVVGAEGSSGGGGGVTSVTGTTPISSSGGATPAISLDANGVTNTKLRQSVALSVIGRAGNTTGNVADIVAASDGTVLRRSGTGVGFGTIPESSVVNLVTDLAAKVTAVTGTTPISSTGGTTPNIEISQASSVSDGFLSSTDWSTFNNKATVAGSAGQVIYNNSGAFAGADITTDGSSFTSSKWSLNADGSTSFSDGNILFAVNGSGSFSGDNIIWDAAGNLTLMGGLLTTNISGGGDTPGIAAGVGAGTGPTVSLSSGSSQVGGIVNVTTGTLPTGTGAAIVTITFPVAFTTGCAVLLTPGNAATALLSGATMVFPTTSTTTFIISSGATALPALTALKWHYVAVGL